MSTRCNSWGKGGRCERLTNLTPSCAVVMKSGNLNFLEPSGPLQQKLVPGVFPGGKGGLCIRLTTLTPSCAVVMKSWNLNFLVPYGPLQQKLVPGVFPGGKGGRCVRLTTLPSSCAVVMKSGNLNFLEPSGPLQACNGTTLPFYCVFLLFHLISFLYDDILTSVLILKSLVAIGILFYLSTFATQFVCSLN